MNKIDEHKMKLLLYVEYLKLCYRTLIKFSDMTIINITLFGTHVKIIKTRTLLHSTTPCILITQNKTSDH